jgi:hypothetical protein
LDGAFEMEMQLGFRQGCDATGWRRQCHAGKISVAIAGGQR